jgi:mRNA-degrading endonuclease RelE of RelBE toxin-antitoxin system
MSYRVETLPSFEKEAKILAKKYKSLRKDLSRLVESIELDPTQGTPHWGRIL